MTNEPWKKLGATDRRVGIAMIVFAAAILGLAFVVNMRPGDVVLEPEQPVAGAIVSKIGPAFLPCDSPELASKIMNALADAYSNAGAPDAGAKIRSFSGALNLQENTDERFSSITHEEYRNKASPENIRMCVCALSKLPHAEGLTPRQKEEFEEKFPECKVADCYGPAPASTCGIPFPIVEYRDFSGLHVDVLDPQRPGIIASSP
jgi:hypothetical protein